jgi:hypothetical protein
MRLSPALGQCKYRRLTEGALTQGGDTSKESQKRSFIRSRGIAGTLSALYPKEGEEKRLLDAILLAMPK